MDGHRFDTIARALAAPRSRRGLLKTAVGAFAAAVGRPLASTAGAAGICDPALAAKCQQGAAAFYKTQQSECRGLLRSDPTDPAHSAQLMFSCLAGAQVEYNRERAQCAYQPCDPSNCEQCVNGTCQSACPPGVSCVGGQCAGCPGSQHKCGADCCLSDQVCCNHVCCPSGVSACDPNTGGCLTCSAQNCASGCCDSQGSCQPGTDPAACGGSGAACAVCSANDVCQSGTCETQSCLVSRQTCGGDAQCCSGYCRSNACCQPQASSCTGGCCPGLACDEVASTCQPACANGLRSCSGTCQQCCVDGDCGSGQSCQNGSCQTQSQGCPGCTVQNRFGCECLPDLSGAQRCIDFTQSCLTDSSGNCVPCGQSSCPTGYMCYHNSLGQDVCLLLCGG